MSGIRPQSMPFLLAIACLRWLTPRRYGAGLGRNREHRSRPWLEAEERAARISGTLGEERSDAVYGEADGEQLPD